jgi:alkaline phosphatase
MIRSRLAVVVRFVWPGAVLLLVSLLSPVRLCAGGSTAKNLIVLISDGTSLEQFTMARWYVGAPLALDEIRCGSVWTYSADSIVTDSAASATAFATGQRTCNGLLSVSATPPLISTLTAPAPNARLRPLATVLEGARLAGKSTGIVVTCPFTHATPAAYYAHAESRALKHDIAEQAVHGGVDVLFGGGLDKLLPREAAGSRDDGEDLLHLLRKREFKIVRTAAELSDIKHGRVWGLFSTDAMAADIDRPSIAPDEPTLAQMTAKAIALLSQNGNGFFLLVEGSQIDWGNHAHDPAHAIGDLVAFDDAVRVALDFAKRDGKTLLLAISDHNTGGFSIGSQYGSVWQMKPEQIVGRINRMKMTLQGLKHRLGPDPEAWETKEVMAALEEKRGISVSEPVARLIRDQMKSRLRDPDQSLGKSLGQVLEDVVGSPDGLFGWTTFDHTGGDTPLHAFGPGRPVGMVDAPEIGRLCARALGFDLDALSERLFVDASSVFSDAELTVAPARSIARITKNGRTQQRAVDWMARIVTNGHVAELPVNQNILRLDGEEIMLEGVVVRIPATNKVYLPAQAVKLIRR